MEHSLSKKEQLHRRVMGGNSTLVLYYALVKRAVVLHRRVMGEEQSEVFNLKEKLPLLLIREAEKHFASESLNY